MTINQLIDKIEAAGYSIVGGRASYRFEGEIFAAPVVLIPKEPPVRAECIMVPNLFTWDQDWENRIKGYVRMEVGVALERGALFHMQFTAPVDRTGAGQGAGTGAAR